MGRYEIAPVETTYKNTVFRSRLEARWALFMDEMGIKWQYEPETFNLGGIIYRPDFFSQSLDSFAEVKPDWAHVTKETLDQCVALSKSTNKAVVILDGMPDFRGYRVCTPYGLYSEGYACITLDKLAGDMDFCIRALGENVKYKAAVDKARGHHFDPSN